MWRLVREQIEHFVGAALQALAQPLHQRLRLIGRWDTRNELLHLDHTSLHSYADYAEVANHSGD
jgi:hypothetical protein